MKYRALAYNKAEDRFYYVYGLPSYGFDTDEIGEMGTPDGEFIEINPATLGRGTGYTDITGKEIFTGDITELKVDGEKRRFTVIEATVDREYNVLQGFEGKTVKVRLKGVIAFEWQQDGRTHILLPCVNKKGITLEEAERNVHNYLDRVKRRMKRVTGQDLKYMLVTEYTPEEDEGKQLTLEGMEDKQTKAVRIHHHIIINGGLSRDELEMMWSTTRINWKKAQSDPEYRKSVDYLGFVNCDRLQPNENGIEGLVNYINKRKKGCKKWSTSMNLKKPMER